ncbi:hypothetical protein GGQ74_000494 [Desulfobaculum xiamenense]|uniref:Uncharacterized protein n=1 Tax=Desulfobaculum xiamenense TaxID=995050 RepID=A0A846QNQ5_9BACT|nr:hypothetical protein [Desulfobaculum xiamenense]NJB66854.1 hypothetical protein [Desulfobaculum xiamenense]
MPNMDYPGPCPSCALVENCDTEAQRKQRIEHYCKGLEMELNSWKARLFDIFADDKRKTDVEDTLQLIRSTLREIEMQMEKMRFECPMNITGTETAIGRKFEDLRVHYSKALSVLSPGYFGG